MIKPSHVGLCTPDLEATMRFFTEGLGFDATDRFDIDSESVPDIAAALEVIPDDGAPLVVHSQVVQHGDFAVELLGYDSPTPSGTPATSRATIGLTHLALWVDDLDGAVDRAVAAGGSVIESTRTNPGVNLVFLSDPAGVRIELMELPG
ncbi:MAG: VOC family protein [Actinomycetia bacterium]|nr:VOC family protein [Actinomycetes bacterium]